MGSAVDSGQQPGSEGLPEGGMVSTANSMRGDRETAAVRPVEVPASLAARTRPPTWSREPVGKIRVAPYLQDVIGVTAEATAKRDAEDETVDGTLRDEYPPVERVYLTGRSGADGALAD
jgi:hypothetical protein